jgi:hypothetical protein
LTRPVSSTPYLPNAGRAQSVQALNAFDQDLNKALFAYLSDLARRANASLGIDGSDAMTGDLDLGGFDITNIGALTMLGALTAERLIITSPNGIYRNVDTGLLHLAGGNPAGAGANIELYGGAHASQPNNAFYDAATHTFRTIAGALTPITSAGVAFPATQIASAGANTLDDYEEGNWTPVLSFGGASTGITYTTQTGRYTKVGRAVTLEMEINLSSRGSATGAALISGFPFQSIQQVQGVFGFYVNMAFGAGSIGTMLGYGANGTAADVRYLTNTTTVTADHNAFNNTSRLIGSLFYLANA